MLRLRFPSILLLGALVPTFACDPEPDAPGESSAASDSSNTGDPVDAGPLPGYPMLTAPCRLDPVDPTRLVVSSTDDDTGAVGLVDVLHRTIRTDLALAQTDLALSYDDQSVYVINRFNFDYIDVLDPANLALRTQFSVSVSDEVSANPVGLVVDAEREAYVTLFGADVIRVFDVSNPAAALPVRDIDMSSMADADGTPEMGLIVACGDTAFIVIERLDRNLMFQPVDASFMVPLDLRQDRFYDVQPGALPDGFALRGLGGNRARLDPRDPAGHTILLLNSGLEAVNLATGTTTWVISDATFQAMGVGRYQLRNFDIGADGMLYFVIASSDWTEHGLYRASLEGGGADLEPLVGGFQTVTGAIEVIGSEGWFADTTIGASGLRIFTITAEGLVEAPASPLGTGLPPYGMIGLP